MNNFFASAELLFRPELRGFPVAVCGDPKKRHGIVLAKNMLAKECGVTTGEAVWQARQKCPGLVTIPPHGSYYLTYSHIVQQIYTRYTDRVEPFGIDECWLDVTGSRRLFGDGMTIADSIRETVKRETGLSISVGVSFNKLFAKLGSDMKKPDAVTAIDRDHFRELIFPLPVDALMGAGRHTAAELSALGIHTIGQLAAFPEPALRSRLGKCGTQLWRGANGLDTSPVELFGTRAQIKSIGCGITCERDLLSTDECWPVLLSLCEEISRRLQKHRFYAGGLCLELRDNLFGNISRQQRLSFPEDGALPLARSALQILADNWDFSLPLRAISLRTFALCDATRPDQRSLFVDYAALERQRSLQHSVYGVRDRYGQQSLVRAALLCESKMPTPCRRRSTGRSAADRPFCALREII